MTPDNENTTAISDDPGPQMDGPALLTAIENAAQQGYERFEINLKTFRVGPVDDSADDSGDHALAQVIDVMLAIAKDRAIALKKLAHALDENDMDEVLVFARQLTGKAPLPRHNHPDG